MAKHLPRCRHFGTWGIHEILASHAGQTPLEEGGQGAHQGPALNAPPNHPRGGMHPQGKPLGVQIYV